MNEAMIDIIGDKIKDIEYICLNKKYSSSLYNDISILLSEVIDRLNWITLGERTNGVYLSEKQYTKLLEYKHMYEDLCK